jgi:tRNA threonylcarbamoyladenosine biosynthesis protein TsaB
VLKREGLTPDAVAVSSGPGSYTGLRIGASLAKGVCFGYGIPLVGVPTLELLASSVIGRTSSAPDALYCAMLDARRMEVYAAIFDSSRRMARAPGADIVTADTYRSFLDAHTVYFLGNGADKCREVITSPRAIFVPAVHPLAVDMIPLAEELLHAGKAEDAAVFEPFYLKEFMATTPKNKIFTNDK